MPRFRLEYQGVDGNRHTVELPDVTESQILVVVLDTEHETDVWPDGLGVVGIDFVVEQDGSHVVNTGHWPRDEEEWVVAASYDTADPPLRRT